MNMVLAVARRRADTRTALADLLSGSHSTVLGALITTQGRGAHLPKKCFSATTGLRVAEPRRKQLWLQLLFRLHRFMTRSRFFTKAAFDRDTKTSSGANGFRQPLAGTSQARGRSAPSPSANLPAQAWPMWNWPWMRRTRSRTNGPIHLRLRVPLAS